MPRQDLEQLSLDQLHKELAKHSLPVSPDPAQCIDTLMLFFERRDIEMERNASKQKETAPATSCSPQTEAEDAKAGNPESLEQTMKVFMRRLDQQQLLLEQMCRPSPAAQSYVAPRSYGSNVVPNLAHHASYALISSSPPGYWPHYTYPTVSQVTSSGLHSVSHLQGIASNASANVQSNYGLPPTPICLPGVSQTLSALATMPTAQAVSLLASQIPTFGGREDKDVAVWVKRIDDVAAFHSVTDSVNFSLPSPS